jgi:endonuclease YncB( thermonuclease family)
MRQLMWTVVVSTLVSSAVLGGLVWHRRTTPAPSVAAAKPRAPEAQAKAASPLLDPASSPVAAVLSSPGDKLILRPPYTIINSVSVRSGKQIVRLTDLDGPHQDAVCHDSSGGLWACGLRARVAFNNLITGHSLECSVTRREGETILAHCLRGSSDVGGELVAAGWARPALDKQAAYSGELHAAREGRAGLWESGWRIRGHNAAIGAHIQPP